MLVTVLSPRTVDAASTKFFHAIKEELESAETQVFKTIAQNRAYGVRMNELLASADEPPSSTENLYPVPQENSYQPPSASNPWGVSTPQAPVLPKAAQNFALLPSNGYDGESQGITSPAVANPVGGTPNDSNEWSTILNIPGLAT
ncbi:hypothetical protein MMC22_007396 [Lobaria immixta]|nr:hypothetical protein [Lobaria immixta]